MVGPAGSAPAPRLSQSRMRTITLRAPKWIPRRESRPHGPAYEAGAFLCQPQGNVKWCSREDLHLELPRSHCGVHGLLHLGNKMVRYAGAAPALSVWKTDVLAVTPIPQLEFSVFRLAVLRLPDLKVAAGAGIAPACAAFQTAAHLSEPSSDGWEWSFRVVSRHGLPVIGRRLCF